MLMTLAKKLPWVPFAQLPLHPSAFDMTKGDQVISARAL
jgi:hypothetical protein